MKKYFVQYKPFLIFLAVFFGVYIVLTFLYQFFLNGFENGKADAVTRMVAGNSLEVVSWINQSSYIMESEKAPAFILFFHNKSTAQIVEGCNGISVIILFISFVAAFSGSFKNTLLYIFGGSLIIYILNVLRIAVLTVLLYYFPDYTHLLHGVLFPLIIYGLVFVLWVVWVNKFSRYAK